MTTTTQINVTPEELAEILARKLADQEHDRQASAELGVLGRLSLLTIDQVAELAGKSVTTARKWAKAGYFPATNTAAKERYPVDGVLQFIAAREDRLSHFPK